MRPPLRRIFSIIVGVLFALSPWLSLGFATPVVFGAGALVMRSRLLGLATGVYAAAAVTTFATTGAEDGTTASAVFKSALAVNLLVGGIHAVLISPRFTRALGRRAATPPAPLVEEAADLVATQTRAEMVNDPVLHRALRRDVLADLPGFDAAMAAHVVAARERHGGLESGAELVVHADVPQEVVDRLHDRLLFTPRASLAAGQPGGIGPEQPQPPE